MQLFHIHYDGVRYPVFASNHVAARKLGLRYLADKFSVVECDKVAVVDPAIQCAMSYEEKPTPNFDRFAFAEVASGGYDVI